MPRQKTSKDKDKDADAETPTETPPPDPQNALEQAAKKNKGALMETALTQAAELEALKAELAKRDAKRKKSALADDQSSVASSGSDTEDDVVVQKKKKQKEKNAARDKSEMSKISARVGKVKGRVVVPEFDSDDEDPDMKKKFKKWLKAQAAGKGKDTPAADEKDISTKALAQ